MNRPRFLIGLGWLASVVVVFFAGTNFGLSPNAPRAGNPASAEPAEEEEPAARVESGEAGTSEERSRLRLILGRAAQEVNSDPRGGDLQKLLAAAALAEIPLAQLPAALEEVARSNWDRERKRQIIALLLQRWAGVDGPAALAYANEKLDPAIRRDGDVSFALFSAWARHDSDAAWKWVQAAAAETGFQKSQILWDTYGAFMGMAAHDLDSALDRARGLEPWRRNYALVAITRGLEDNTSRQHLLERLASLPREEKAALGNALFMSWAAEDSEGLARGIRALPKEARAEMEEMAIRPLMSSRPSLGAELRMEKATDADRALRYHNILSSWDPNDLPAAGEWLEKLPPGPELDAGREAYALNLMQKNPALSMERVKDMEDPQRRKELFAAIYEDWVRRYPVAATQGLEATGLSAEEIEKIKAALGIEFEGFIEK